ncbi:MAG TPA: hypothetical protein VMU93_02550 [Caulobacteraceae bacterium]|nr:hypothetical protein [Caulobacteraceae bacterium]
MMANAVQTWVRLRPGASAAEVDAGLAGFVRKRMIPDASLYGMASLRIEQRLKPLSLVHLQPADQGDAKPGVDPKVVAAIGVIGILIIVIAAINFVTLTTARASRRAVEVGVRKALGARRLWRSSSPSPSPRSRFRGSTPRSSARSPSTTCTIRCWTPRYWGSRWRRAWPRASTGP